jgi:hypothetical protein
VESVNHVDLPFFPFFLSSLMALQRESTFWWIEFSLRALWWIEFSLRALSWISRIRSFCLRMPDYVQYFRATVHFVGSAGYSTLFLVQDAKPVPVLQS